MKIMKKAIVLLLGCAVLFGSTTDASAATFTPEQQKRVDTIYKIVSNEDNWNTYGSLPSVCIAQAVIESGVGKAGNKNNLWGLGCGRSSYKTLKAGVYAYMQCINKDWYKRYGATETKSWKKQIRAILKGGYCVPAGGYYREVARVVKEYNLEEYDKLMFAGFKAAQGAREAEKKEKLERQKAREAREAEKKAKEEAKKKREKELKEKQQQKVLLKQVPGLLTEYLLGMQIGTIIG